MKRLIEFFAACSGVLSALILAGFLFVGLYPFHWRPPRWTKNDAQFLPNGTLRFASPGLARTLTPAEWIPAVARSHRLTVRLKIRSFSPHQSGPARILSVSADRLECNLLVGQEGPDLFLRLRFPGTYINGEPYLVRAALATEDWHDLQLDVENGRFTATLDGRGVINKELPEQTLRTWDANYYVTLGNEPTGDRAWLGEIAVAQIDAAGETYDYLRPEATWRPRGFWAGLHYQSPRYFLYLSRRPDLFWDAALNLVCFIPLGFSLAMAGGRRGSFWLAAGVCILSSLGVELLQICFEVRMPSVVDWTMNSLGGIVGAGLGRVLARLTLGGPHDKSKELADPPRSVSEGLWN